MNERHLIAVHELSERSIAPRCIHRPVANAEQVVEDECDFLEVGSTELVRDGVEDGVEDGVKATAVGR